MITMHHHIQLLELNNKLFKAQSLESLLRQIKWLKKNYDKFEITFDDGLKSHLIADDVLMSQNIRGTFYYPTSIVYEKKVLTVHLLHILLKDLTKNLLEKLYNSLNKEINQHQLKDDNHRFIYRNQGDFSLDQKIKTLVNYVLNPIISRSILEYFFKKYLSYDLSKIFDKIYLSNADLVHLHRNGHKIEPHFHSHILLTLLDDLELEKEFDLSVEVHESLFGVKPKRLAVPYGSALSWDKRCEILALKMSINTITLVDDLSENLDCGHEKIIYESRKDCCLLPDFEYF